MSKHLVRDMENLQRQVLLMAGYVEEAIHRAIQALQHHDKSLAQEVAAADDEVDDLDNEVTEGCLKLLALHQPGARDLRRVAAVLMFATDLESNGRPRVRTLPSRAVSMTSAGAVNIPAKLTLMANVTTSMVHQSLDSFVNLERDVGRREQQLFALTIRLTSLNAEIINNELDRPNEIVAGRRGTPVFPSSPWFATSKRIADHATNIAENVLYLLDGEIVRHRTRGDMPED